MIDNQAIGNLTLLISNMTFLANPGAAFAGDWRQITNSLMVLIVMFPVAFILIPLYRNIVGMSLYEFFEKRFGYGIRTYGAGTLSLLLAAWLTNLSGKVLEIYYSLLSIFAGGLLGLVLLAFISKKANNKGAGIGIISTLKTLAHAFSN